MGAVSNINLYNEHIIMDRKFITIAVLLILSGCATATSYTKPGVNWADYRKIAVTRLDCVFDPAAGQEVADIVAIEFIKKGYDVIERSQLRAILSEEELSMIGLTESSKLQLELKGIKGVVIGSLSRYDCRPDKAPIFWMGSAIGVLNTNNCQVSLSLKILDVQSGEVVWAANGAHSLNAVNMTANKVLKEVISILRREIP